MFLKNWLHFHYQRNFSIRNVNKAGPPEATTWIVFSHLQFQHSRAIARRSLLWFGAQFNWNSSESSPIVNVMTRPLLFVCDSIDAKLFSKSLLDGLEIKFIASSQLLVFDSLPESMRLGWKGNDCEIWVTLHRIYMSIHVYKAHRLWIQFLGSSKAREARRKTS